MICFSQFNDDAEHFASRFDANVDIGLSGGTDDKDYDLFHNSDDEGILHDGDFEECREHNDGYLNDDNSDDMDNDVAVRLESMIGCLMVGYFVGDIHYFKLNKVANLNMVSYSLRQVMAFYWTIFPQSK